MKRKTYRESIRILPSTRIYLNVDQMKSGRYEIQIIHNQKIIKTIYFEKP